ncbi:MAG: hypothetical protein AB8G22_27560 [Saprospiraceae bacterium]
MKKILFLLLTVSLTKVASAQIEQYTKDDILDCLELILEHPIVEDALQRDMDYQDEFDLRLRDEYVRFNPVRKLLQDIDQIDISDLNDRLYLTRQEINRNRRDWTSDNQRRNLSFLVRYDDVTDAFSFMISAERKIDERQRVIYNGSFFLERFNEDWEITADKVAKSQQPN